MDKNLNTALALYKLSSHHRELLSDHLVKANAPNAKDLCTGHLDFAGALHEISSKGNLDGSKMNEVIQSHTHKVPVTKSVREASVDLSSAYITNTAMLKLLNHSYKQGKAIVDGYRPQ